MSPQNGLNKTEKMSDELRVSIIMPAFNSARYIREAIDSVLAQTWHHWELIVVNDGSTDETGSIVQDYHDERIVLVEQENRGVSAARNVGLGLASGEFVTFLDSDDILPPGSLKARVAFLENNREVDIVDGQVKVLNENLDGIERVYSPYYRGALLPRLLRLDDRVFCGTVYMVRSSVLSGMHFTESMKHAEDLLFFTILAGKCDLQYAFVDEEIYRYRKRAGSAMSDVAGLEAGYLDYMRSTFSTVPVSLMQRIFLRLKISKIMFLSWARHRRYTDAIVSVYRCLWCT